MAPYLFGGLFCGMSWMCTFRIDRNNHKRVFLKADLLKHFESQYSEASYSLSATLNREIESEDSWESSERESWKFWMETVQKDLEEIRPIFRRVFRFWWYGIAGNPAVMLGVRRCVSSANV